MYVKHKKRFGQNFISDVNFLRSLVNLAGISKADNVLEIGAGAGALTRELAAAARFVAAYEIDRDLEPILTAALKGAENVRLVLADALKADNAEIAALFRKGNAQCTMHNAQLKDKPQVSDREQSDKNPDNTSLFSLLTSQFPDFQFKLVANLPYYITTPLIFKFLDAPTCAEMAVMVQKEVAERLAAKEGTAAYGALTVAVGVAADVKILKRVPRKIFYPVPDVDSAFVSIKRNAEKFAVSDRAVLSRLIGSAFAMRRKTLANNLMRGFSLPREQAETLLKAAGLPLNVRGEALSPARFVALGNAIADFIE
ncbi:MAG: 16S rRNA (adenine(1518)-N(6)/adenine(1519)-N(6))-dimethyltransferase [Clostridiales bacterium]|jgi:16S rRNA (adenine1518-N6/adenine1519-N6)-dimethyltransferase|nr:16S rRNA (adenine(1518)-N(6)/adenine(1519)-N(6))-dimethyltransferase [Clostridiales bacterium]